MVVRSDGNVLTILTVSIVPVTLYLVFIGIRDHAEEVLEDLGDGDDDDSIVGFDNPLVDQESFDAKRTRH